MKQKIYKCENCKKELDSFGCETIKTTIDKYDFIENVLEEQEVIGSEIRNYFCPLCGYQLNHEKIRIFLYE